MDAKLQLRVQRYGWDAAAAHYEDSWRKQLASAQQVMLDMANLLPGHKVLETACGTGLVTFAAAKIVGGTGMILATDLAQKMVDETFDRSRKAGLQRAAFGKIEASASDGQSECVDVGDDEHRKAATGQTARSRIMIS